jgi:hypothetical protein
MNKSDLINPEVIFKESILAKLKGLVHWRVLESLNRCGNEETYQTCKGCGAWKTFYYRCSMKFCPMCNWRIARKRSELIKTWTKRIRQPKHLVLTQTNFDLLTRKKIRESRLNVSAMRRSKLWSEVRGGCVSTEITNGGNGWHLHHHFLLDVRWLDIRDVSIEWGRRVGQEFAVVKIKDVREAEYLGELTKYVVKPAQLSSWNENLIAQFIHAIRGIRFFSTFGTLFLDGPEVRREMNQSRPPPRVCECGCGEFRWSDERSELLRDVRRLRSVPDAAALVRSRN